MLTTLKIYSIIKEPKGQGKVKGDDTMEKMTKIEMYSQILTHLTDADEIAFIKHEIELTAKKNASRSNKPTKVQIENASLADEIYSAMVEGQSYRISDIKGLVPALADANPQKISAIVSKMRKEIRVSRELVKGVAYFTKI